MEDLKHDYEYIDVSVLNLSLSIWFAYPPGDNNINISQFFVLYFVSLILEL